MILIKISQKIRRGVVKWREKKEDDAVATRNIGSMTRKECLWTVVLLGYDGIVKNIDLIASVRLLVMYMCLSRMVIE